MEKKEKIIAKMIIEVIGKPKEHLTKVLEEMVTNIGNERNVEVKEKKLNDPIEMKDQKDFYSSFAEVEVEVEDILLLTMLMFKYMPSHIEIISPENIKLTNNNFNEILNELTRRLHGYDEVARVLQMQNVKMQEELKKLQKKD